MGKWIFLSGSVLGAWLWVSALAASAPEIEAADGPPAETVTAWSDTSRDVYVDGVLEHGVGTYVADEPPRLALAGGPLPEVVVVDLETLEISTLPKASFEATPEGAVSPATAAPTPGHRAAKIVDRGSSQYLLQHRLQTLLVAPNQGPVGSVPLEELWQREPAWKRRMLLAEPDPEIVEALRRHPRDARITVVLGTWCGDSRSQVPPLLAALHAAANPRLEVEVVGILRGFQQPAEWIRERQIINVPTVLVEENGHETGRVIETPALDSIEEDLVAILGGRPPVHQGRYERGPEVRRGRYVYRNPAGEVLGHEQWTLYLGEEEGRLLHSKIETGGMETEIFHRRRADGTTRNLEITRRGGSFLSRTRAWEDEGEVTVHTRGDGTGIVRQDLTLPEGGRLWAPGSAEGGFDPWHQSASAEITTRGLRLGPAGTPVGGEALSLSWSPRGDERIATPAGEIRARRYESHGAGGSGDWWIDPATGLTLKARLGETEVILEELVVSEVGK